MVELMHHTDMVRNIAIVGHLHHGKTTLVDVLVEQTHHIDWDIGTKVSVLLRDELRDLTHFG
jgi:translation elongation factor EF-G